MNSLRFILDLSFGIVADPENRDSKFTEHFCAIVENDGIEFKLIPPRSPNLNPFAERWVQSVKRE